MASCPPLRSYILLLLSVASSASVLVKMQNSGVSQTNCSIDLGDQKQRCFTLGGGSIVVVPNIYLELPDRCLLDEAIQQDPLDSEFYFEVPLKLQHRGYANYDNLLIVTGFEVKLVSCRSLCDKVSVVSDWPQVAFGSDRDVAAAVRIGCGRQRYICQKMLMHMKFTGSARNRIGAMLQFAFFGQAYQRQFTLTMTGLPVVNAKDDQKALSDVFWFEENKILLFSIAANSGYEAAASFLNSEMRHPVPIGDRLPTLFRSGLIDRMSQLSGFTGMRFIVAEMRAQNRMVAQVVFDISVRQSLLNKVNWFDKDRVVSSHPYPVGTTDYFGIPGDIRDVHLRRTFLIKSEYGGCAGDKVFWTITDTRDPCAWGNKNWGGLSPSMMYTSSRGLADATGQYNADQFIAYLM